MEDSSARQLEIGQSAPPIYLGLRGGDAITLDDFDGQPLVVALLDQSGLPIDTGSWQPDILRAEARGLEAALLVVSPDGVWCFRPDDQLQRFAPVDDLDAADMRGLRRGYGLAAGDGDDRNRPTAGLYVVDGQLRLRFAHLTGREHGTTLTTLIDGLAVARRALDETRGPPRLRLSRDEMVVSCLCGALSAFLSAGGGPAPATTSEVEITLQPSHPTSLL